MRDTVHVCQDAESLAQHACDWLLRRIQSHCSASSEPFSLALSGGSTPKRLYELLAALPEGAIDWRRVVLVWGDERNVSVDHADSNFRMVKEALLNRISIPAENVLAVPAPGGDPAVAASAYEALLQSRLPARLQSRSGAANGVERTPALDCVLLGMGDDVHTASLFPGTTALEEQQRLVVENFVEKLDCWRITLTAPFINAAKDVVFLVAGESKQLALQTLWHAPVDVQQFPSQLIRPESGGLWFMVDQAAVASTQPPEAMNVELFVA